MSSSMRSGSPGLRQHTSLSVSSFSSGSLNDGHVSPPLFHSRGSSRNKNVSRSYEKSHKDRHCLKRHRERTHKNKYSKLNLNYNRNNEFDKKGENLIDKKSTSESYSMMVPNSDSRRISPSRDKYETKTYLEDCMNDPSTCNFQNNFYPTEMDSEIMHGDSKVFDEKQNANDETKNRLERLEKLVDMLVNGYGKQQSTQKQTYQDNLSSEVNVFELIPRNSKFTTSMWLNRIDQECMERNFDEKMCIEYMKSKMTGIVKAWFKTFPISDFTWPELKMRIIQTFPDNTDFATTLKFLVERSIQPNETMTQYYYSKMYLLDACKISGENAVSCLLDGLENEQITEEGKQLNFLTPEALYSQFLSKLPEYQFSHDFLPNQEENVSSYEEIHVADSYPRQNKSFKNKNKLKKCFTCNKVGHIAVDCRHAPMCYGCKNMGHIMLNCPLNN